NDISTTVLNWGDGTVQNLASGTHAYENPGAYSVRVTATDKGNLTGTAVQAVTASAPATNLPPSCALSLATKSGQVPLTISATATCTDPENDITTTVLNWGDGTVQNLASGTHVYAKPGTYSVRVTATDKGNLTGTAVRALTATAPATNLPPRCSLSLSSKSGQAPRRVRVPAPGTDTTTI